LRRTFAVNARASIAASPSKHAVNIARAEHISIEADTEHAVSARTPYRKVRAKYALHSALRKCSTELAILDDHYLQVHALHPHRLRIQEA
jgi:hypothetical protein